MGGATFYRHSGWGGGLGLPSRGLSPNTRKYSFLPRSPYLHYFSFMFFDVIFSSSHGASFGVNAQTENENFFLSN